ncbi:hypothetical protein V5O48_017464 [Marasmius crinis-equi]|uniref:Uncharacterized protein n=1 Tax=Marasmius crinis-equi TaxID=585013 RepID=A0ABR3ENY2_9AGAR
MTMEIDNISSCMPNAMNMSYYAAAQRDVPAFFASSSSSLPSSSSSSSTKSSLGKIRIPPLCQRKLDYTLPLDDEDCDYDDQTVDSFLESIALGTPRRTAGSKRVMRAMGQGQGSGQGQVLQAMRAMRGSGSVSGFESMIAATAKTPQPLPCVQSNNPGSRLVPPSFLTSSQVDTDVAMSDA